MSHHPPKKIVCINVAYPNLDTFKLNIADDCSSCITNVQFLTTGEIDLFFTANEVLFRELAEGSTLGCLDMFKDLNDDITLLQYFSDKITALYPAVAFVDLLNEKMVLNQPKMRKPARREEYNVIRDHKKLILDKNFFPIRKAVADALANTDALANADALAIAHAVPANIRFTSDVKYFKYSISFLKRYKPLLFPADKLNCKNLLLISEADLKSESRALFYAAANSDTLPVVYYKQTLRSELQALLVAQPSLERMALVTHNGSLSKKYFLQNELFFTEEDLLLDTAYSPNVQFMLELPIKNKKIDFLMCNSLQDNQWRAYYALLAAKGGLQIGASNDLTGNLAAGGDWVMETTQEDVQRIYFNESITHYQATLFTSTIYIDFSGNEVWVNSVYDSTGNTYNIDMTGNTDTQYQIENHTDNGGGSLVQATITFSNFESTNVFSIDGNLITIDGSNNPLDLTGIIDYTGLISVADGYQGVEIKNINIEIDGSSTLYGEYSGWVCHGEMVDGIEIQFTNCAVRASAGNDITLNGLDNGCICGGFNASGTTGGTATLTFTSCSVTGGDIAFDGYNSGGICGGDNSYGDTTGGTANLTFTDCIVSASAGNVVLGSGSGGICGGYNAGGGTTGGTANLTFTDCTVSASTGDATISGDSGGICGGDNGNGDTTGGTANLTFTDCIVSASAGNVVLGSGSGGICGGSNAYGGIISGTATLNFTNCSVSASAGNLTCASGYNAGFICGGYNANGDTGGTANLTFTDCTVTASADIVINSASGGICGGVNATGGTTGGTANLTFTDCTVTASTGNITFTNQYNGGICGGYNANGISVGTGGTANFTFTNCAVTASASDVTIGGGSGGICGGNNGNGDITGGTVTITFTDCSLNGGGIMLSGYNSGGICGGSNAIGNTTGITTLTFMSCLVTCGSIEIDSYSGGICGGSNGIGFILAGTANLTFTDCTISASTGDVTISGGGGGICGGYNASGNSGTANLTFTSCSVTAGTSVDITDAGGICGGFNAFVYNGTSGDVTLSFTTCSVTAGTNMDITDGSGICGGVNSGGNVNNGGTATLTFIVCDVSTSDGNMTITGTGTGICGGFNSFATGNTTGGTATLSFTSCSVTASRALTVGDSLDGGGICGGVNASSDNNGGTVNMTFTTCSVTASSGDVNINSSGICGNLNAYGGNTGGVANMTFINCSVITLSGDVYINDTGSGICGGINASCYILNGGGTADMRFLNCSINSSTGSIAVTGNDNGTAICGGNNANSNYGNNSGTLIFFFTNCILYYCNSFTYTGSEYISPYYFKYNDPIIILGDNNALDASIYIDTNSRIQQQCTQPPPPPPPPTPSSSGRVINPKLVQLMDGGNDRAMTRRILRSAFNTIPEDGCSPLNVSTNNCKKINSGCKSKKFGSVPASERTKYLKLKAMNQNYADSSFGGDDHNGSSSSIGNSSLNKTRRNLLEERAHNRTRRRK